MLINMVNICSEIIIFATCILICTALLERRFSRKVTLFVSFGTAALILTVQALTFVSGESMLALTLLPVTAYLPFGMAAVFLSKQGLFETAAACSISLLGVSILKMLKKILQYYFSYWKPIGNIDWLTVLCLIIVAAMLVFLAFRYIRRAFRLCMNGSRQNRLLVSVPMLLIFLLFFWFLNSTTDMPVLLITLVIVLSVYLIIAKLLYSSAELLKMRESEKAMAAHMELFRQDYEAALQKMEAGKIYRHDMRHHLLVLEGLAKQEDVPKILEYINKLNGGLSEAGQEVFCKNSAINAVLSTCIRRAKSAGCKVTAKIAVPEEIPFEEMDVCMVLANAIENAVNACGKMPADSRYIDISAELPDTHKLILAVRNPCPAPVAFDKKGMPVADSRDGHGIGLRSVRAVTEKYNGLQQCKYVDSEFRFHAVLFHTTDAGETSGEKDRGIFKKLIAVLSLSCLLFLVIINLIPATAQALSSLLSVNIRTVSLGFGDTSVNTKYPEFSGDHAEKLNQSMESFLKEADETFWWYLMRKYEGYVAADSGYRILRDDETLFIVKFYTTLNVGGSVDFSRYITLDKRTGEVLSLGSLFREDSDYIRIISEEILRQMEYRVQNERAPFFIPGGIWPESSCFKEISPEQNFYINAENQLVIVFDEYEVAAGNMGMPEFVIPAGLLEDIAR